MTETSSRRAKANSADGAAPFSLLSPPQNFAVMNAQTAQAMLVGFDILEANLNAYRSFIDTMRTAARRQQDAVFSAMRAPIAGATARGAEEASPAPALGAYFAPFLAATKAYEKVGEAVLDAQRSAVAAIAAQAQTH